MKITVESIPSAVPEWYSPDKPGFKPPKNWTGSRIRITIPVGANPTADLDAARIRLQKKYVGAELHLVPEYRNTGANSIDDIDTDGTDEELLTRYFGKIDLPEGITIGQITAFLKKYLPSVSPFGVQGMTLESVEAVNVLCFERVHWNMDTKGQTLITGVNEDWDKKSNGSGKSSFVSLPFIGLFGRTFKDQTHDGWANQANELPAKLLLNLTLADKRKLRIERQRRPALLKVFLDGNEVTMGTPAATQALIERLTNMTWEVLTNAVYIGQREIGSVFGTDKDRKELFGRLLGLDRFFDAQAAIRRKALRIQREAENIESDITSTKAARDEASNGLRELRSALKNSSKVSIIDVVETGKTCRFLAQEIASANREISATQNDEKLAVKSMQDHSSREGTLRERLQAARKNLENTKRATARCQICGNVVNPTSLASYRKELENSITRAEKDLELQEEIYSAAKREWTSIRARTSAKENEIRELTRKLQAKQSEADEAKRRLQERTQLEKGIEFRDRRVKELERILGIHERAYTLTLEEKQFVDICSDAVGRNGLPAWLCGVVIPELNAAAAHYSDVFSDGEIGIRFEASGGDVDVRVCNLHGGKNVKDQSAGEMRLAGIIAAFAFREVLVPLNILICDEPGEGLDAANSAAFARGLSRVTDRFRHVAVISHNTHVLSVLEPDTRIEIMKKDGISVAGIV